MASACAHARHTDDTHAFPQTTLFVVSKSMLVVSSARHLLVTEKKTSPPFRSPPHLEVPESRSLEIDRGLVQLNRVLVKINRV